VEGRDPPVTRSNSSSPSSTVIVVSKEEATQIRRERIIAG
jgi:hypothetical protein